MTKSETTNVLRARTGQASLAHLLSCQRTSVFAALWFGSVKINTAVRVHVNMQTADRSWLRPPRGRPWNNSLDQLRLRDD